MEVPSRDLCSPSDLQPRILLAVLACSNLFGVCLKLVLRATMRVAPGDPKNCLRLRKPYYLTGSSSGWHAVSVINILQSQNQIGTAFAACSRTTQLRTIAGASRNSVCFAASAYTVRASLLAKLRPTYFYAKPPRFAPVRFRSLTSWSIRRHRSRTHRDSGRPNEQTRDGPR